MPPEALLGAAPFEAEGDTVLHAAVAGRFAALLGRLRRPARRGAGRARRAARARAARRRSSAATAPPPRRAVARAGSAWRRSRRRRRSRSERELARLQGEGGACSSSATASTTRRRSPRPTSASPWGAAPTSRMESADAVLVRDDLRLVADLVRLSRRTYARHPPERLLGLLLQRGRDPARGGGLLHPIVAAGAMAASSLFVVGELAPAARRAGDLSRLPDRALARAGRRRLALLPVDGEERPVRRSGGAEVPDAGRRPRRAEATAAGAPLPATRGVSRRGAGLQRATRGDSTRRSPAADARARAESARAAPSSAAPEHRARSARPSREPSAKAAPSAAPLAGERHHGPWASATRCCSAWAARSSARSVSADASRGRARRGRGPARRPRPSGRRRAPGWRRAAVSVPAAGPCQLDQDARSERPRLVQPARRGGADERREVTLGQAGPLRQPARIARQTLEEERPRLARHRPEAPELQHGRGDPRVERRRADLVKEPAQLTRATAGRVGEAHAAWDLDRQRQRRGSLPGRASASMTSGGGPASAEADPGQHRRRQRGEVGPGGRLRLSSPARKSLGRSRPRRFGEALAELDAPERVDERAVGAVARREDALGQRGQRLHRLAAQLGGERQQGALAEPARGHGDGPRSAPRRRVPARAPPRPRRLERRPAGGVRLGGEQGGHPRDREGPRVPREHRRRSGRRRGAAEVFADEERVQSESARARPLRRVADP